MQVDRAGTTIPYYDCVTGEATDSYLFAAVLPCSCYAYVEACDDMKTTNWLLCHVYAYQYFGGVTRLLIPDNLKTGVSKTTRYETILNKSYAEMAEYYETSIVPARVRALQDKNLAEGSVKFATKVPLDYLITDGKNKYSVPFDLTGKQVDIRLTKTTVEVFFHGSRVASHPRSATNRRDPVIQPEHMPTEHLKYLSYNVDDFTVWAISIGNSTAKVSEAFFPVAASLNKATKLVQA